MVQNNEDLVYEGEIKEGFFKRYQQGIIGAGIGAVLGSIIPSLGWLSSVRKRKRALVHLESALEAIIKVNAGELDKKVVIGKTKEEIDAMALVVHSSDDLREKILRYMVDGKIKGEEKKRWEAFLLNLTEYAMRLAQAEQKKEHVVTL